MTDTSEKTQERKKPSWQEIQEKKISMAKERGARVLKVNCPSKKPDFHPSPY